MPTVPGVVNGVLAAAAILQLLRVAAFVRALKRGGFPFSQSLWRRALIDSAIATGTAVGEAAIGCVHCRVDVHGGNGTCHTRWAVVFVHGGAWAWGGKHLYSGLCSALADGLGVSVFNVGYRLYPHADMRGQVADIRRAVAFVRAHHGCDRVVLVGHSSGGHLCSLSVLLQPGAPPPGVVAVVALCAPLHIGDHYQHEAARVVRAFGVPVLDGVAHVSPMAPAAGGADNFDSVSPRWLVSQLRGTDAAGRVPHHVLVHTTADTTVPVAAAEDMAAACLRAGVPHSLRVVPGDHTSLVTDTVTRRGSYRDVLAAVRSAAAGLPAEAAL